MRNDAFWRNNKCKIFIGGAILTALLALILIIWCFYNSKEILLIWIVIWLLFYNIMTTLNSYYFHSRSRDNKSYDIFNAYDIFYSKPVTIKITK